jgi:hypothetical protein
MQNCENCIGRLNAIKKAKNTNQPVMCKQTGCDASFDSAGKQHAGYGFRKCFQYHLKLADINSRLNRRSTQNLPEESNRLIQKRTKLEKFLNKVGVISDIYP